MGFDIENGSDWIRSLLGLSASIIFEVQLIRLLLPPQLRKGIYCESFPSFMHSA